MFLKKFLSAVIVISLSLRTSCAVEEDGKLIFAQVVSRKILKVSLALI